MVDFKIALQKGALTTQFRFRYSFPDTIQQYHRRAVSSDVSVGEILQQVCMIRSIVHNGSQINFVVALWGMIFRF